MIVNNSRFVNCYEVEYYAAFLDLKNFKDVQTERHRLYEHTYFRIVILSPNLKAFKIKLCQTEFCANLLTPHLTI